MRRTKKTPKHIRDDIIKRILPPNSESVPMLADEYGMVQQTIYGWLRDMDINIRLIDGNKHSWESYRKDILKRIMPPNNEKPAKVSRDTGVPSAVIYYWRKVQKSNNEKGNSHQQNVPKSKYSDEFKMIAIKRVLFGGESVSFVSMDIGVSSYAVGSWVKKHLKANKHLKLTTNNSGYDLEFKIWTVRRILDGESVSSVSVDTTVSKSGIRKWIVKYKEDMLNGKYDNIELVKKNIIKNRKRKRGNSYFKYLKNTSIKRRLNGESITTISRDVGISESCLRNWMNTYNHEKGTSVYPYVKYSDEFKSKTIDRVFNGESVSVVSRDVGASTYAIREWINKYKLNNPKLKVVVGKIKYTDEFKSKMIYNVLAGNSIVSTSRDYNVPVRTIQRWLTIYRNKDNESRYVTPNSGTGMKRSKGKKKYSDELKLEVSKRVVDDSENVINVSKDVKINATTIYRWARDYRQGKLRDDPIQNTIFFQFYQNLYDLFLLGLNRF